MSFRIQLWSQRVTWRFQKRKMNVDWHLVHFSYEMSPLCHMPSSMFQFNFWHVNSCVVFCFTSHSTCQISKQCVSIDMLFYCKFLSVKCLGLWSGRDVAFGRPVTSQMTWRHHVALRPRTMPKGRYNGSNFIYPMVFFLKRHRKVDYYDHCCYASWLLLGAFVCPSNRLLIGVVDLLQSTALKQSAL
jgi:hypothetical protein